MASTALHPPAPGNRVGDWMQTVSGRAFWPRDPRPEEVSAYDIGHALAHICRYGGHSRRFYSVAEHSVLVSQHVPTEHALWGLLHDASEAYLGDMVRPLKATMSRYRDVEQLVQDTICQRFGLHYEEPPEVKEVDLRLLVDERAALMGPPPHPWHSIEDLEPLGVTIEALPPEEATYRWWARFHALTGTFPRRDV